MSGQTFSKMTQMSDCYNHQCNPIVSTTLYEYCRSGTFEGH